MLANGKALETKEVKVPANGRADRRVPDLRCALWADPLRDAHRQRGRFPAETITGFSPWNAPIRSPPSWCTRTANPASALYVKTALESSSEPAFALGIGRRQPDRQPESCRSTRSSSFPIPARIRKNSARFSREVCLGRRLAADRDRQELATLGRHPPGAPICKCSGFTPFLPDHEARPDVAYKQEFLPRVFQRAVIGAASISFRPRNSNSRKVIARHSRGGEAFRWHAAAD